MIEKLFEKEIIHSVVVPKVGIKDEILKFL
jgi:hypothetical protein